MENIKFITKFVLEKLPYISFSLGSITFSIKLCLLLKSSKLINLQEIFLSCPSRKDLKNGSNCSAQSPEFAAAAFYL